MRKDSGCFLTIVNSGARWNYVAFETLRRTDEACAVRGAITDILDGSQNKPWWICGVLPAEEVDETDVRQWLDPAVRQCSRLPRPWGMGRNCTPIDHAGSDTVCGGRWMALSTSGTPRRVTFGWSCIQMAQKGRSTTLSARHGC